MAALTTSTTLFSTRSVATLPPLAFSRRSSFCLRRRFFAGISFLLLLFLLFPPITPSSLPVIWIRLLLPSPHLFFFLIFLFLKSVQRRRRWRRRTVRCFRLRRWISPSISPPRSASTTGNHSSSLLAYDWLECAPMSNLTSTLWYALLLMPSPQVGFKRVF